MAWIEHAYSNATHLIDSVSTLFETLCRQAIAQRGHAYLSLAGGRTPLPLYAHLAQANLQGPVLALPGDERCVAHTHAACNWRNLKDAFAQDTNISVVPLTTEDGDVAASLQQTQSWLQAHPQPFDAVLLGMGADGHFASLFPGAANITEGLSLDNARDAIATTPDPLPPEAPFPRISMTLARLTRTHALHLAVTGEDKRLVLQEAQRNPQAAYPVATLLHASPVPIHIHWSP